VLEVVLGVQERITLKFCNVSQLIETEVGQYVVLAGRSFF